MNAHSAAETPARPLRKPARRISIAPRTTAGASGGPWPAPRTQDAALERALVRRLDRRAGHVAHARVDPIGGHPGREVREQAPACGVDRLEQRRRNGDRLVLEHDAAVAPGVELVRPLEEDHR